MNLIEAEIISSYGLMPGDLLDFFYEHQYMGVRIMKLKFSLAGQPLHKRGRVWSTLHCGFMSTVLLFLGVLTPQ